MFNKETEYALRGLVYIQYRNTLGKKPGVVEIAGQIDAPSAYIAKILQRLVRTGFLNSAKGKGGGFYFDELKGNVSLLSVVEAIQGPEVFKGCGFGLKECNERNPCPLHNKFKPIRESLKRLMAEESIQTLASRSVFKGIIPEYSSLWEKKSD